MSDWRRFPWFSNSLCFSRLVIQHISIQFFHSIYIMWIESFIPYKNWIEMNWVTSYKSVFFAFRRQKNLACWTMLSFHLLSGWPRHLLLDGIQSSMIEWFNDWWNWRAQFHFCSLVVWTTSLIFVFSLILWLLILSVNLTFNIDPSMLLWVSASWFFSASVKAQVWDP